MKNTKRKGFNFYRSYYDVFNELPDKDKLPFIKALLDKQFLDVDPEKLSGMVKFAWVSQYNSIDNQVKGYKSKTKDPMQGGCQGGWQGGSVRGKITPTLQEEEKEKEKEKDKREKTPPLKISKSKETDKELKDKFIAWFNIRRSKHLKKESKIKSLSITDLTNLKKLKKDYGAEDFNIAFNALQRNKWANDNNMIIPKHFLVNDNFNKYYAEGQTIEDKPLEELTALERLKRIHK